jgi:5,10-methylenetetrahydromethanopterin reductase
MQRVNSPALGLLVLGRYPPDALVDMARRAEEAGFDTLWFADERFFRDCWTSLGFLAAHTSSIKLGVCVTDPFIRHPALTATSIATLDEISGGRAILGLGAGVSGFRQLGIQRDRPITAIRESIELLHQLLGGEEVSYEGAVVSFMAGRMDVPARPDIPVMIATNGPKMLELAGSVADSVMVQNMASTRMVANVRDHVAAGASATGRDPTAIRLIARLDLCVSDSDPVAARDRMRAGVVRHLATHHPRYESFRLAEIDVPDDLRSLVGAAGYSHDGSTHLEERIPDEWIDRLCLAGTSSEITLRVGELIAAGIDEITIMPVALPGGDPVDVAVQFARHVVPDAVAAAMGR